MQAEEDSYLGLRRRKWQDRENYKMRSCMICTPHWVFFGWSNQEYKMGKVCGTYGE